MLFAIDRLAQPLRRERNAVGRSVKVCHIAQNYGLELSSLKGKNCIFACSEAKLAADTETKASNGLGLPTEQNFPRKKSMRCTTHW